MMLDQLPPNEQKAITDFFRNKTALIVEEKKTAKGTIKKMLISFGVHISKIETAESIKHAKSLIKAMKHDIVFCNEKISEVSAIDLIDLHSKLYPNRSNLLYALIGSPNSVASACKILDSEIDDYIAEPFSATSIAESFLKLTKRKMNTSVGYTQYHQAKAALSENDLDKAEQCIEILKEDFDYADEAYYLEGKLYLQHGDEQTSLLFFEKALEINFKHYSSLKELIKGYQVLGKNVEAYETTKKLLANYPINPSLLPDLIRLSLLNKQYDDLLNFSKFFQSLDEKSPSLRTNIAASLVICGKYYFESGNNTKAIQVLLEATKSSMGKLQIIQNIVQTLILNKEVKVARDILYKFEPLHANDENYQILEVELASYNNDNTTVSKKGLPLIQKGIVNKTLYQAVIKTSIQTNRKKDFINELIDTAIGHFPSDATLFKGLYKN
ncbi:hypothetical protein [Halobacteriovorax sp. HLS]|uniref:hypothetical protein n=1 Tax=Halobacteriovorax sp. HLS TaxID=2234000 RepID=UPI000FDBDFB6|nr:hypothetical protein [Halobacteriovorax sp. HLS]